MIKFLNFFHSWSIVVICGHSWSLVVTGGHWWSLVVTGGHWWSLLHTSRYYRFEEVFFLEKSAYRILFIFTLIMV